MTPSLDLASLTRPLHALAWRMGRGVPPWVLDHDDFMQLGWLGIHSVRPQPHYTPTDLWRIRLTAARRQMIDGRRALKHSDAPPGLRRAYIVWAVLSLPDKLPEWSDEEATLIRALDFYAQVARLAPRNQTILRGRVHGETLATLATRLGLTEGRVSQLGKSIVTVLSQEVL